MNILYHFRTQGTGAEGVHIAGIASAFETLGHRVVFSSPTGVDPRQTAGENPFGPKRRRGLLSRLAAHAPGFVFEVLELGYNLVAWRRNRALLRRENCTLIYERHAFFLCATAQLAARRGIPLVVEVNELVGDERIRPEPTLSAIARCADLYTFRRAALIIVVSPHLKRRIEAMGIPAERILVLPNAVAADSLDAPVNAGVVRQKYACADAVIIGFVGWFVSWHRLENLVRAFADIAHTRPAARLMLVGDGDLRPELAKLADDLIFTGAVPHGEIPDHIAAMDICVVPHSNEYRSPIKLFEYMANGRAVLAARTEPIAMVVRDGENGVLFDSDQPSDLRAKLLTLIDDAALRAHLGAQARADVRRSHTWSANAAAVLAAVPLRYGRHDVTKRDHI